MNTWWCNLWFIMNVGTPWSSLDQQWRTPWWVGHGGNSHYPLKGYRLVGEALQDLFHVQISNQTNWGPRRWSGCCIGQDWGAEWPLHSQKWQHTDISVVDNGMAMSLALGQLVARSMTRLNTGMFWTERPWDWDSTITSDQPDLFTKLC